MSGERKIEFTSAQWWGDLGNGFEVLGMINKERPDDAKIPLEIYPVAHRLPISERTAAIIPIRALRENLWAFRDGRVSLKMIRDWQKENGGESNVPVERIHLPFHYNIPTALKNFFWNSMIPLAKPYEPGDPYDRWAIAAPVSYMTMTVANRFATRLAGELNAGLNGHVYIVEQAEKRGTLLKIIGNARYLRVENDLDYPRNRPEQVRAERDPQRAIDAVKRNGLDGVILGIDHAYRAGQDPREGLDVFDGEDKKYLKTLHLSGSKTDHGLIQEDDWEFWDFLHYAKEKISDDVTFCLDLSPKEMQHLTYHQQVDYLKKLIKRLEK